VEQYSFAAGTTSFSLTHQYLDDNPTATATDNYTIGLTITDDDTGTTSDNATVTVNNVAPEIVSSPTNQSEQYSDSITPVIITVTDVGTLDTFDISTTWSKDGGSWSSGLPDDGTIAGGLALTGPTSGSGSAPVNLTLSGQADLAPGTYIIRVNAIDDDGGSTDHDITLVVTPEDAVLNYAGLLFVTTDPQHQNDLELELRAVVQDITFFGGADVEGGDITRDDIPTGTVTFVITNEDGPGTWTIPDVLIQPLAADPLTGVAVYNWIESGFFSNSEVSTTLKVEMIVGDYYTGSEETLVTVAKPEGDFITGGGYLIEEASYGGIVTFTDALGNVQQVQLDVADGSKMNFGFNVKYNKQFTNLQGNFTGILRMQDGSQWQLKTNATNTLQVGPHPTIDGAYLATFEAKANLKNQTVGGSIGGLTMIVEMIDYGEPGSQPGDPTPDTISFTLWDGPTLIFSSNWTGSEAFEQDLTGGNLQIHTQDGETPSEAPTIASLSAAPYSVVEGANVTLTATGVADADGTVTSVDFYRDTVDLGTLDASDDLLGTDTDGSDGWSVTVSTTGFSIGTQTYFAEATDNDSLASAIVSVTGEVTSVPTGTTTTTYASGDVHLSIPSQSTITSTIEITAVDTIADLNVQLDISHSRAQDLDVYLIAPDGTRIELFTDVGGNGDNFSGTILDDEAATAITNGSAPFVGSYQPEGLLSVLDGTSTAGTWTLEITDDKRNESGTLNSWSLIVESGIPLTAAALAESSATEAAPILSNEELEPIVNEAVRRWTESGLLDAAQLVAIESIEFEITNLAGTTLGLTTAETIVIDTDAAGYGWYVDVTPSDDLEFSTTTDDGTQLAAGRSNGSIDGRDARGRALPGSGTCQFWR
jgi:subtilisin-like proprotein convertase family protein